MMFGKRTQQRSNEAKRVAAELEDSRSATEAARQLSASAEAKRPRIESIASYLENRRARNGFGEDFTIAMTRRTRG